MAIERRPPLTGERAQRHAEWSEFFLNDFRDYVQQIMREQEAAGPERTARAELLWALAVGDVDTLKDADADDAEKAREFYRIIFETWIFQKLAGVALMNERNKQP